VIFLLCEREVSPDRREEKKDPTFDWTDIAQFAKVHKSFADDQNRKNWQVKRRLSVCILAWNDTVQYSVCMYVKSRGRYDLQSCDLTNRE
jgi:hypothetical protein